MKVIFKTAVILCMAFILLATADGIAQEERIGTNAASELLIPVGARYMAMGGAPVATVSGVDAIYWNPAGAATSNYNADAMFSHMQYIADIDINYAALNVRFGGLGTIGFSVKALAVPSIPITTVYSPDGTGGELSPQFLVAGLTYAKALTDRISIGASMNLISEDMEAAQASASGIAFDFGVQYRNLASIEGLSLGVVLKNLGPAMQYSGAGLLQESTVVGADRQSSPTGLQAQKDELPAYIVLGASYSMTLGETSKLELMSTFQDNNYVDDLGMFGAEYNYDNLFFVRAGYSMSPNAEDDVHIYGMSAGAGIHYDFSNIGITVDYAYRAVDFFDANNVFTVKLGF